MKVIGGRAFVERFALNPTAYAWLLGAGASATAGIPTGYQMIQDFRARLFASETGISLREVDASDPVWQVRIDGHHTRKGQLPPKGDPLEYSRAFEALHPTVEEHHAQRRQPDAGHDLGAQRRHQPGAPGLTPAAVGHGRLRADQQADVPLALLGVLLLPLWEVASQLVQGLVAMLGWLAGWPFGLWSAAAAPLWGVATGVLGGVLLLLPLPWRLRLLGLPLPLPLLAPPAPRPAHGEFEAVIADVGQGTAVLLRTRHHLLLYDAGPRYGELSDAGQRVLLPLLRAR